MGKWGALVVLLSTSGCSLEASGLEAATIDPPATDATTDATADFGSDVSLDAADASPDTLIDTSVVAADTDTTDTEPLNDTADVLEAAVDSSVDAGADTLVVDASDAGCPTTGGDPCTKLTRLVPKQVVDGSGAELCAIPPVKVEATNAEFLVPAIVYPWATASVQARIAWSADGLHAHFAVTDPTNAPAPTADAHYNGDCIELFAAGHTNLTGKFDGTVDKGAVHVIFTRPNGDGTRAGIHYDGLYKAELPKAEYATVTRVGGYDVEVHLTWKFLEGMGIVAGSRIGLDFALNDRRDLATGAAQYMGYRIRKPQPVGFCGGLYCDDRVWCQPLLE